MCRGGMGALLLCAFCACRLFVSCHDVVWPVVCASFIVNVAGRLTHALAAMRVGGFKVQVQHFQELEIVAYGQKLQTP
jgi:hypothetical protein